MKVWMYRAMVGAIVATAVPLFAQTASRSSELKTTTVTVEAIEKSTREITIKRDDGTYDVFYASPEVKRFDSLKVGDKITARYYENIVLTMHRAGEPARDTDKSDVTRAQATTGATASHQRTITATITAIDQNAPSITFTGPRNWTYSTRVEDKKALSQVKVGDKVDLTWTEAMIVSLDGK
jgi:hypothetical protein